MARSTWAACVRFGRRRSDDPPTPTQILPLAGGPTRGNATRRVPTRADPPPDESARKRGAGPSAAAQNSCRPRPARQPATGGNETKRPGRRSASQRRTAASVEISVGLGNEVIELAGARVGFDLLVPSIRNKFFKPLLKVGKLLGSKIADGGLNILNTHDTRTLQKRNRVGKCLDAKPSDYFFTTRCIPHFGQSPGLSLTISGCITQVYCTFAIGIVICS